MAGNNATYTLDFGPAASGLPTFEVFRDTTGTDYLASGLEPSLGPLTNGYVDFQWSGVEVHFRAELLKANGSTIYIAGELNQLDKLPLGDGSIYVDHDYPTTDSMRILNDNPPYDPIEDAFVYFFLTEDWNAGRRNKDRYLQAWTRTINDGRFLQGVYIDPNEYTVLVVKAGAHHKTKELTVEDLALGV